MFKLVVLCVFATAVAEPQLGSLLYGSPLAYPAVVPAATIAQPGLIAQPAPVVYSSPYGLTHFIKKRSADAEPEPEAKPEASPEANPEAKPDPQLLTYGSSLYYPSTYTSAFNSFIPSYSAYPYSTYPLTTHLIKKRSAQLPLVTPLAGAYAASWNSGIPSLYNNYIPSVPTTYLSTYPGVVHAIKKRSAQVLAAPAYLGNSAYAAASPIFSSTYASSPYISTLPYVASPWPYIKK